MEKTTKGIHYAWVICGCCLLATLCNLGLCSNILAAYLPFIEETGITGEQGSSMVSIRCFASVAGTLIISGFYNRLSLRKGLALATLIGAAGATVLSVGGSYPVYAAGAAILGLAFGLGTTVPTAMLIERWFRSRRATAIAACSAGSGLASILFAPIVTANTLKHGLRSTFLIQAGFEALCALLILLLVRDDPAELGMAPFGGTAEAADKKRTPEERFTVPRYAVLLMYLMILINGAGGSAASSHVSVCAKAAGYTAATAGVVATLYGGALFAGKLLFGGIADRFGTKRATVLFVAIYSAGCLMTCLMDGRSLPAAYGFAGILGVGCAYLNAAMPLWAADLADEAFHTKLLRGFQLMYATGGILFTFVPGKIADRTGEYRTGYLIMLAMALVGLALLLYFYRRRKTRYR